MPKIKIFLVSDPLKFALTDVYKGYINAFEQLGVECVGYPFYHFDEHHKRHICISVIHSEALVKENGYTHILFVGGLNIPGRILESFHGKVKTGIIATEDPHTFEPLRPHLKNLDFYFTNEFSMLQLPYDNIFYCPTAADNKTCGSIPREHLDPKYHSDVLFLGALYPNRQEYLKTIVPFIRKNNLNFKIVGHPQFMPKESVLWDFVPPENYDKNGVIRTIDHEDTVKYYAGAKVVLNFHRDANWNAMGAGENPLNAKDVKAWSLNPRAYEVPLCGGFQLLEDTRAEARYLFKEEEMAFFSDRKSLIAQLEKYLLKPGSDKIRAKMAQKAMMNISLNHTYLNRAQDILRIIS